MYNKETLKKIIPYCVKLTIILLFCGLSYVAIKKVIEYVENQPKVVTELYGVSVGEKLADVLFKNAGFTIDKDEDKKYGVGYSNERKTKQFNTENGIVTRVMFVCEYEDTDTEFAQIKCNAKGEEVLKKYGKEVKVLCRTKDDEFKSKRRLYDVEKYGIRFGLEHNKVLMFLAAEPNKLNTEKTKEAWSECD